MKIRSLLLCVVLSGLGGISWAQDVIVLTNRAKIDAKEIVIKGKNIVYEDYSDPLGEVYVIGLTKVDYIHYANGEKLYASELLTKSKIVTSSGDNLINFHVLDFVFSNFSMSYERILAKGKFSLQLPISFGYGDPNDDILLPPPFDSEFELNFANRFSSGLCFKIFPTRQGKVRYFFGPGIMVGSGVYSNGYLYDEQGSYYDVEVNTGFVSFMVNNGLIVTPIAHFSISLVGSLGARHFFNVDEGKTTTSGRVSFNLSYRF